MNKAIKLKNKNDLLKHIATKEYKKLDLDEMNKEEFERKEYLTKLDMHSARRPSLE